MAEKKDSFTFSDKLKDSKPAPAPFSKRFSASKLGTDGKPRKTFFERTKRDAPFFIAALIVLLLLPFFVKFTGPGGSDINDTPVIKDAIAWGDPVYDTCFDEFGNEIDNCLLPQAGRSSFDLIPRDAASETADAFDVDYTPYKDDSTDSYRESGSRYTEPVVADARRAMSGAVRRTPTQIGNFRPGTAVTARGRVGTGWSGISAQAAKTGPGEVARAAKPISLQPLTAANKLGRSMTGEAALAEAQRSLGAMNKREAMQALMDSQLAPTVVGRGGLTPGRQGAGVGGGGMPSNKWSYKGMKPWWWDLEQKKAWAKWEYWFKLWADPLKAIVDAFVPKFGCCLLTGNDECDVDKFFGTRGGSGEPGNCQGISSNDWDRMFQEYQEANKTGQKVPYDVYPTEQGFPSTKAKCLERVGGPGKAASLETTRFKESKSAAPKANFFQVRGDCLGLLPGEAGLSLTCQVHPEISSYAQPSGKAEKWHIYTYVIVQNYTEDGKVLCGHLSDQRIGQSSGIGANNTTVGVDAYSDQGNDKRAKHYDGAVDAIGGAGQESSVGHMIRNKKNDQKSLSESYDPNDCVIFITGNDETKDNYNKQKDQGRIFREHMLRQRLLNVTLPKIYGCTPDEEINVEVSNNKTAIAAGKRSYEKTDGTRSGKNFKQGSCHPYLSQIFVKQLGALAMKEPLAIPSFETATILRRDKAYLPELPLTVRDFNNLYVDQKGNDYRKQSAVDYKDKTKDNIATEKTRDQEGARSSALKSEFCLVARNLSAYSAGDYCKKDGEIYRKEGEGFSEKPISPEEKKAASSVVNFAAVDDCDGRIKFYTEYDKNVRFAFYPPTLRKIDRTEDSTDNKSKCCPIDDNNVSVTVTSNHGSGTLIASDTLNYQEHRELIGKICGPNKPELCADLSIKYMPKDKEKNQWLKGPVSVNLMKKPLSFIKVDGTSQIPGYCCKHIDNNGTVTKVEIDIEGNGRYEVPKEQVQVACGEVSMEEIAECGLDMDFQLYDSKNNPLLLFVKYRLTDNMPRFRATFNGPSNNKGKCCHDSRDPNKPVTLTIGNASYVLTADKYTKTDITNLCQGQESTSCPFEEVVVSTTLRVNFVHDQATFSKGAETIDNFVNALVVAMVQKPGFISSVTVEGHTDWSGAFGYNMGQLPKDRIAAIITAMNTRLTKIDAMTPPEGISENEWAKVKTEAGKLKGMLINALKVPQGPKFCTVGLPNGVTLENDFINSPDGRVGEEEDNKNVIQKMFNQTKGGRSLGTAELNALKGTAQDENCRKNVIILNNNPNQQLSLVPGALYSAFNIKASYTSTITVK